MKRTYKVSLKLPQSYSVKEAQKHLADVERSLDLMAEIIKIAAVSDGHALELQRWIKEYTLQREYIDAQIDGQIDKLYTERKK
jgi:hypothetical protein